MLTSFNCSRLVLHIVMPDYFSYICNFMSRQGFATAFCMDILVRWVVLEERTFLTTMALFGIPIGSVISHPVSGYVAHILGWRAVFYFSGK